jgi:hypothetical protein
MISKIRSGRVAMGKITRHYKIATRYGVTSTFSTIVEFTPALDNGVPSVLVRWPPSTAHSVWFKVSSGSRITSLFSG